MAVGENAREVSPARELAPPLASGVFIGGQSPGSVHMTDLNSSDLSPHPRSSRCHYSPGSQVNQAGIPHKARGWHKPAVSEVQRCSNQAGCSKGLEVISSQKLVKANPIFRMFAHFCPAHLTLSCPVNLLRAASAG